jgi:hypothetical protein
MDLILYKTPSDILQKHRNIDGIVILDILYQLDISSIVDIIIENDFSVLLRKMVRLYQYQLVQDNMKTACLYGSEDCMNYLIESDFVPRQVDIMKLIENESISCLYLLMEIVSKEMLIYESINRNKIQCLDFSFSMNHPLDIKYVEYALHHQKMDVVKYFIEVHQCISISIYEKAWDEKMFDFCQWLEMYFQNHNNEYMVSLCKRIRYGKTPSPVQCIKEDMDDEFESMFENRIPVNFTENEILDIEFNLERDEDELDIKHFERKRRMFDTMILFSSIPESKSPMTIEDFSLSQQHQWK